MSARARIDLERAGCRKLWSEFLLSMYASLESALWTAGTVQGVFVVLTVALATHLTLSGRRSLRELALEPSSIRGGWWVAPAGAAIGGVILLSAW